jgi:amino acid transporter
VTDTTTSQTTPYPAHPQVTNRAECLRIIASVILISSGVHGDLLTRSVLLTKFVNVATGAAFAIVAVATMFLRVRRPDLPRTFTAPFLPFFVTLAVAASGFLIYSNCEVLGSFAVWLIVGVLSYLIVLPFRIWRREG